jgi:hypothetical protein
LKEKKILKISEAWSFVKNRFIQLGFLEDMIHGVRHISHVMDIFLKMQKMCRLNENLEKTLHVAVAFHDLGRIICDPCGRDHAEISASAMMGEISIPELNSEEWRAAIAAVRYHSSGLASAIQKADTLSQQVLGLLVLCDHADACFCEGMARAALHLKKKEKPILSSCFSTEEITAFMEKGFSRDHANQYKADSLAVHCAYNFWALFDHILPPVQHLLSKQFIQFYTDGVYMFKVLVDSLLLLQGQADQVK